jgi:hypothetical protein
MGLGIHGRARPFPAVGVRAGRASHLYAARPRVRVSRPRTLLLSHTRVLVPFGAGHGAVGGGRGGTASLFLFPPCLFGPSVFLYSALPLLDYKKYSGMRCWPHTHAA